MKLVKICDMLPVKKLRILINTNIFVMTNIFKYFIFIYILYIFFIEINVGNIIYIELTTHSKSQYLSISFRAPRPKL